jgi:phosphoenolpyruvate carboxykinase (ATP)
MVWHPTFYMRQLGDKIHRHQTQCWLVNTGWSGGPYGEGDRIRISYTRAIVAAILDGRLDKVDYAPDPAFAIDVPQECPGVPNEVLQPRSTWRDQHAYDVKAQELVRLFNEHFSAYEDLAPELKQAAPKHT